MGDALGPLRNAVGRLADTVSSSKNQLALVLGVGLLLLIAPLQALANPSEPSVYCAQEDTYDVSQLLCMERESRARERLYTEQRWGRIAPGIWSSCTDSSASWRQMEGCVVGGRALTYTWALWSFGGEVNDDGLVLNEGWTRLGTGYESAARCDEEIGAYVRSLLPTSLRIERNVMTPTGSGDRFQLTFKGRPTVSLLFSCTRGPTQFEQSP